MLFVDDALATLREEESPPIGLNPEQHLAWSRMQALLKYERGVARAHEEEAEAAREAARKEGTALKRQLEVEKSKVLWL